MPAWPVPDGRYAIEPVVADGSGEASTSKATVVVDYIGPDVTMLS